MDSKVYDKFLAHGGVASFKLLVNLECSAGSVSEAVHLQGPEPRLWEHTTLHF